MNTQSSIPITREFEESFKTTRLSTVDLYFLLWAPFMLIQSVVVLPVKGTTLGYLLALLSPIVVLLFGDKKNRNRYLKLFIICLFFYSVITLLSQFGNMIFRVTFGDITLVDFTDERLYFRRTLFTQSLYLLAGFFTFLFIKTFYKSRWDNYLFTGAVLLACYGLYEILYFHIFGSAGDFLSNRTVGSGDMARLDGLFQTMNIGGFSIMRLKSLTGEPSMYSFSILPFWIYALYTERFKIAYFLFATLLLTTSTTAMLGMALYFIFIPIFSQITKRWMLYGVFFLGVMVVGLTFAFDEIIQTVYQTQVVDKLTLQHNSGASRFQAFADHLAYYAQLNPWSQLVGQGFGTIRSMDLVSTLLVNTGIVGFLIFTIAFFYPVLRLKRTQRNNGIKVSLIVIYVTAMISVSEFGYLSIWIFLGLAYHQLSSERQQRHFNDHNGIRA